VPADALDPYALGIRCAIRRQGRPLYEGMTNTGALHRRLDTLVAYLGRHNQFPAGAYLMTGTGLVPPDDVALRSGDEIVISIAGLGTLRNVVA
jgi:2-dehydro-3-deoxy-D-arabinonate dehydratase